ncbi:MAG: hypothetical protein Ct9H300mP12_00380 [Acidimicrobiales bacterium]|nr:MAG: hypothetical protein Ct9H300mP12_00380 [Acidimicrobiales bacterium]
MIKLEGVSKIFKGDVVALKNATAEIQGGEFVFLVGPSGSGKSTFIRLLNREEVADSGRIMVAGKDVGSLSSWKVPYLRRNIGYIFQDYKLLPKKTVYENVAFGLEVMGPGPRAGGPPTGPGHPRAGRLDPEGRTLARRVVGRRAATGINRTGLREPAAHPASRRAHGKSRPGHLGGHHATLGPDQPDGHDGGYGHPRPETLVDTMRRRVIELDRGVIKRDESRGVYEDGPAGIS